MKQRIAILILLIGMLVLGAWLGKAAQPENAFLRGSLSVPESQVPDGVSRVGDFQIEWDNAQGGQLTVRNAAGKILWQTPAGEAFVMAGIGDETVSENRGMFSFRDNWQVVCAEQSAELLLDTEPGFSMTLGGFLHCNDSSSVLYSLYFEQLAPNALGVNVWLQNPVTFEIAPEYNRFFLTYNADPDEHFFGFGEQFTYFDMKGKKVPIWVSEQGVGRGEQPITAAANLTNGGAGGNAFTTYAPIPFYITSHMRSFTTLNPEYTVFDLTKKDRVQIQIVNPSYMTAAIIDGDSPQEIIATYTQGTGRMAPLPDWVYTGALVGMQGGTEKVEAVYAKLQERNTPVSAFWLQDWVGQRTTSFGKQLWWNWEVDYDRYPNWDQMVADFNEDDVRVMVYASPYLADIGDLKPNVRRNLFQEAKEKGYLVMNTDREPYLVLNTDFYFGMVDLSNQDALLWYMDVLKEQVVDSGASGWMADFGEGLPYDASLASGDTAAFMHNLYPVIWAAANRGLVDETDSDLVFFTRAAYGSSAGFSTLFWEGDQLVSWSEHDGIKSAVTGLNTSGLSGMAFNHSDIGGYTTITSPIKNYHRSRELLYRWMEMNAFTLIFRTHEGNQPENNVQFYTDNETLDTFAYWAKVYAALFDYRKQLVQEAAGTGLPVVRHPFIHYPDDPETWKITSQEFMLGEDFLIAPVTDPGADEVRAYLPAGGWVHLWTGAAYGSTERGEYVTVSAPIGQPGVFYKKGSSWGEELAIQLESENLLP